MLKTYSLKQIKDAELAEMASCGITEDDLIARAASCLLAAINELGLNAERTLIFAGKGNNGGDGIALAKLLTLANKKVKIVKLINDINKKRIKSAKIEESDFACPTLVIDAIFGTGLNSEPKEDELRAINEINRLKKECGATVVAVDIPSGLLGETGIALGACVFADYTIALGGYKNGLFLNDSRNYTGKTILKEIGIELNNESAIILEGHDIILKERQIVSHKNSHGKLTIIAGSGAMVGASLLAHESALAALRSGAGLCTLAVPSSLKQIYQLRVKEEMLAFLSDNNGDIIFNETEIAMIAKTSNSIVVGMGMGADNAIEILKIIKYLAQNFNGTLILDADALNALAKDKTVLCGKKCDVILTPHIGEFARLTNCNKETVIEDAEKLARELDVVLAVKSATTIITNGVKTVLNITGSPCMAKGGSGDVLAGIIGALSLTALPFNAASFGCFIFGKAGERAQKNNASTRSVIASDIIGCI